MADLEFKHNVQQIPAGAELPQSRRTVTAQVTPGPDVQSAASNYAENSNWMSALGSEVATRASNALAAKLGSDLGKNPQGDIGPSFTDFDKNLAQSYATQAQSTLGLQAQKLITQSNLELASAPRINADLIAKSQRQIYQGLQKIYSLAPDSVRPQMENTYGSLMIQQNANLTERMFKEQRQDRRNNTEVATKINSQNAHSLALSGVGLDKNGDSRPALLAVQSTEKAYKSALDTRDATPLEAKVAVDSARQSMLSGKYTRLALIAEKDKKLPEFLREMADKPPADIKDEDHTVVINNVVQYMNQQIALRTQDQQLQMAKFSVKLAENPDNVTGVELANLQSQLTPLQGQKVKLDLIQALNKKKTESQQANIVMADWGNSAVHARIGEKAQNKAFDTLVQKLVTSSDSSPEGPVTPEMAEIQVAMSAGAPIPVFTKSLQYKLSSGNPQLMESAAQQIHQLYQMGSGHALAGLSEKDKAAFGAIETLRSSLDPTEASRETINKIYNQDPVMFKANQQKWSDYVSLHTKSTPVSDYALTQFGFSKDDFLNPSVAQVYGTDMLEKYSTYYQLLGGDEVTAKRVTQRYIDQNYGNTGVNGGKNSTLHPLEKTLGYHSNDVVPVIQQDIINQMNKHFVPIKDAFSRGETNEYWETESLTNKKHGIFSTTYDPIKVKRYTKVGDSIKSESFDVVIQGNAFDNWDVSVYSPSGLRPLYQVAPYLGVINYIPNKKWIDEEYTKTYHNFPNEVYEPNLRRLLTPGENSNG